MGWQMGGIENVIININNFIPLGGEKPAGESYKAKSDE